MTSSALPTFASLALACALVASPLHADILPSADVDIIADNARGTISTMGDFASIVIGRPGCTGSLFGQIERDAAEMRIVGESCTITLTAGDEGRAQISQGDGCSMYSGAGCGFSGTVLGPAMPLSIAAVDQGFAMLGPDSARALQSALQSRGLYTGANDGKTGPSTRGAIIEAARALHAEDPTIRLDNGAFAEIVMRRMMAPAEPITLDTALPFLSRFDCDGVATMDFRPDGYTQGGVDLDYADLVEITDTIWGIEFTDGYRVTVEADGSGWITWHSPGSGDTFRCREADG